MKLLSFDCGYKTMGVCSIEVDEAILHCGDRTRYGDAMKLHLLHVYDCLDGKKLGETTVLERVAGVKRLLAQLAPSADTILLVELQPECYSSKSLPIAHQIIHHFCDTHRVVTMSPRHKSHFEWVAVAPLATKQATIKKQSAANLRFAAGAFGWNLSHIRAAVFDDAADAFMQAIAYVRLCQV